MKNLKYPKTKKVKHIDNYHGTKISDEYRWLENYNRKEVKEWVAKQEKLTHSVIDNLPQKKRIIKRLNELWRYDEESIPYEVLKGKRIFLYKRKKTDEKWIYYTKEDKKSKEVELINPNKWNKSDVLSFVQPTSDGELIAFGKEIGGNENPAIHIMDVPSKKILKDSVTGWKQGRVAWLHDNSGFFYSCKPKKGERKQGDEFYWDEVYFHKLGTSSSEDKKVFHHDSIKEYYHTAHIDESGKYVIFTRETFGKNEVFFKKIENRDLISIATGFDAEYCVQIIKDKIIIHTDSNAPNGKVYITDVNKPEKKFWKELIPESSDKLFRVSSISGYLFLEYLHKAHSLIKIFSLKGKFIQDVKLPGFGNAEIYGYWSKPTIWLRFSSFVIPYTTYEYNLKKNSFKLFFQPPIKINFQDYETKQIEYASKDGTKITMFLIHRKGIKNNGKNPTLLTGYGGFNVSMTPYYSQRYIVWLEAGGMIALPNLRGGGEYGTGWHESGKLNKKQNVFDDFISAAEWLIKNKFTNEKNLAIFGGSNGGLLVGAVAVQRPDLFKIVDCAVPLLDMLRYHKLSIANTWTIEYGSSENQDQFKYLYKYSPYHNIKNNVSYPTMLITTSENDARVDPMHALKMIAKLQEVNPKGDLFLLLVRKDSGHGGGTTISENINQISEELAFLMDNLNMEF